MPPLPRGVAYVIEKVIGRPLGPRDYRFMAHVGSRSAYGGGAGGLLGVLAYVIACRRWAFTDHMTKVGNRRAFDFEMWMSLRTAKKQRAPLSVVLLDVDHFKKLNDSLGHQAGDQALKCLGRALKKAKIGFPCRYGGEEFVVVLTDTPAQEALKIADELRTRIAASWTQSPMTASAGVATYPADGLTASQLIHAADKALYRSKSEGRNRTTLADVEA